jgi:hypothetical protein
VTPETEQSEKLQHVKGIVAHGQWGHAKAGDVTISVSGAEEKYSPAARDLSHNPTTDRAVRKEIFSVLLGASTAIKHLSDTQIKQIILNYRG